MAKKDKVSNGVIVNGEVKWHHPPRTGGETRYGSYNDHIQVVEQGAEPAEPPNMGPFVSDRLNDSQNLAAKRGTDGAAQTLKSLKH